MKRVYADLGLEHEALKDKRLMPARRREMAIEAQDQHSLTERRACRPGGITSINEVGCWTSSLSTKHTGEYRGDAFDACLFDLLGEVRDVAGRWLQEHNLSGHHEALRRLPAYQFATQAT